MTMIPGRSSPDPGLGSQVELGRRDTRRWLDLISSGKTLASKGIAAEEAPPAFLQVQPTSSRWDKDVMQARMLGHPSTRLRAVMATQIICDNEDAPLRIVGFDILQERDRVGGVT